MSETATHTYETATARIEEIIRRLDSGEAGLRETFDLCTEAKGLVEPELLQALADGLQLGGAELDERAALAHEVERLAKTGIA